MIGAYKNDDHQQDASAALQSDKMINYCRWKSIHNNGNNFLDINHVISEKRSGKQIAKSFGRFRDLWRPVYTTCRWKNADWVTSSSCDDRIVYSAMRVRVDRAYTHTDASLRRNSFESGAHARDCVLGALQWTGDIKKQTAKMHARVLFLQVWVAWYRRVYSRAEMTLFSNCFYASANSRRRTLCGPVIRPTVVPILHDAISR